MKIHKKILTHYLSCTSPVDKEGYLYKKRERNLTYLRRWFVLKGNVLFYQERPGDRSLLGVVVLEGCLVQASEADGQFCFSLVFTGPGLRTYRLAADDRVSQESWISALFSASHIYLSVILKDLERRYDEAMKGKGPCDSLQTSTLRPPSPKQVLASGRGPPYVLHASSILPPDARSNSTGSVPHGPGTFSLQAPPAHFKITNKRSPKLWPKRNAHVTPLNGPAPACGEWPVAMLDPLDFSKLHEYYGNEIRQVQADWLKKQREDQECPEDDLIDLG